MNCSVAGETTGRDPMSPGFEVGLCLSQGMLATCHASFFKNEVVFTKMYMWYKGRSNPDLIDTCLSSQPVSYRTCFATVL